MASHPRWEQVGGNAAEVYERHLVPAMFAPWAPTLIDLADIQSGERILDVACGTGAVTRPAAARAGSDGRVVGLDVNAAMLAVARSLPSDEGEPIEWLEASALAIPLPDAAFDVVLCQQGLQQFPDRSAALRVSLVAAVRAAAAAPRPAPAAHRIAPAAMACASPARTIGAVDGAGRLRPAGCRGPRGPA